jgi:hypothetical protein
MQPMQPSQSQNSLDTRTDMEVNGIRYTYFSLPKASQSLKADLSRLPYSLKVLLENLLRHEDGKTVSVDDIKAFKTWLDNKQNPREIAYLRQFPRCAAGNGYMPSGEPRISGAGRLDEQAWQPHDGVSRYTGGHR